MRVSSKLLLLHNHKSMIGALIVAWNAYAVSGFLLILYNNHSCNTAAQQDGGIEPTMPTNEEDISRVCWWNLINPLKESFALGIQNPKKMEECELIACCCFFAFVHMEPQVLFLRLRYVTGSSIMRDGIHSFDFAFESPLVLLIWETKMWIASDSTSHITSSTFIDITLICVAGNCGLHLYRRSHKHLTNNIQRCFSALFAGFSLFFSVSLFAGLILTPHRQLGFVSVWYLSHILPLLQHGHRLGTARSETSPRGRLILLFSSAESDPATSTAGQERWQLCSASLPSPTSGRHDLGRPSAAAQIRDHLTARWLDLTIQSAGGLSAEVSLRPPLQHGFYNLSANRFCSVLVLSSQVAVVSD